MKTFNSAFPFIPRSPKWAFQVFQSKLCMHLLSLCCFYSTNQNSKFLRSDGTYCCQTMVPTILKRWCLLFSDDGTNFCQTMVPTVVKRWYLLLSIDGTYCCQKMVPTIVKLRYLLLSNDGTYCCKTMVPIVKRWYLLLSNDGTYYCQTMVPTVVKDGTYCCQTMVPTVVKPMLLEKKQNLKTLCFHVIGAHLWGNVCCIFGQRN